MVGVTVAGQRLMRRPVKLNFGYGTEFESASPEAYEHLLLDAMQGDQTLFIRNDEAEAAWRVVDSISSAWRGTPGPKLIEYAPGTWGPDQADQIFEDPYMHWQNIQESV